MPSFGFKSLFGTFQVAWNVIRASWKIVPSAFSIEGYPNMLKNSYVQFYCQFLFAYFTLFNVENQNERTILLYLLLVLREASMFLELMFVHHYPSHRILKSYLSWKNSSFSPFLQGQCIVPNNRTVGCAENQNSFHLYHGILSFA